MSTIVCRHTPEKILGRGIAKRIIECKIFVKFTRKWKYAFDLGAHLQSSLSYLGLTHQVVQGCYGHLYALNSQTKGVPVYTRVLTRIV